MKPSLPHTASDPPNMQQLLRLTLELELGNDSIGGSLDDEHCKRKSFEGWMELAAVLEAFAEDVLATGPEDSDQLAP